MSKKYLVKLTPHDKFFFGGETTFGEGNVNYFVKSNYYPQQTSLLGLVRYQLLLQSNNGIFKNNRIADKKKASDLIGEKSFHKEDNFNFGGIKSISPVFISDIQNNHLFAANKEYQQEGNEFVIRQYDKKNGRSTIYKEKEFLPILINYMAKDGLPDLLLNKNLSNIKHYDFNKENSSSSNGIFIKQEQVGIRKNYAGKTDDKAYYIQIFYKLLSGYSFAFILELDDNVFFTSQNIVVLGGEQSKFKMEVSDFTIDFDNLKPNYEQSTKSEKVVLVSDALLTNDIYDICDFAVTETIDFRSLRSSVQSTNNYAALNKTDSLNKTEKYNLFKKGSVFFGDKEMISKKIKNESLQKLGYNHFKEINKKS